MAYRVRVKRDYTILPNGSLYHKGQEAILTDEQYHQISPSLLGRLVEVVEHIGVEDGAGLPGGGITGQSLVKASDQDRDVTWVTLVPGVSVGDGDTFESVLGEYSDDLVHAWFFDIADGSMVPDEVGDLPLFVFGSSTGFSYGATSPFGAGTAMVSPGGDRYMETESMGNIPVEGAQRTVISIYLAPSGVNSRVYGYGSSSGRHFSLRSRQGSDGIAVFHHWNNDVSASAPVGTWVLAFHGVNESSQFRGYINDNFVQSTNTINTNTNSNFRVFNSAVEGNAASGLTIARIYVFDRWLGGSALVKIRDAWLKVGENASIPVV